jgi:hypothetical protein
MIETIKQLITLIKRTDKIWIIPFVLLLIIVALVVIAAQISPTPIFIYPII